MFAGIQEILVLVVIILGILFLPRIMNRGQEEGPTKPTIVLSGKMRLAIAASILWLCLIAVLTEPWKKEWNMFLYLGLAPVALAWGIRWVFGGFRNSKRQ